MDSPRDCSISHILPMNSARSEYHAMQQQAIRESVDLADQGDVDGDQLSAQLRTLLCNSIIMCKEAPEEGAPDAPLAWHDDLHGDAEQRLLDRSLVEVPEKAMLTREAVKRAEWMSTGKFAVSREAWMAGECPWAGPGAQERDDFISEDPAAARENAAFPRNMRRTTADTNSTIETKNTGRTLSLIDMAESHPPQIEAPTPASTWKETEEDLGPTEEDAAQSEAERLAALRQELHRVLDLLIARPTHQQNSEQITKLQDLESTISVALEEMLVEDGRAKHSPQGSSAVETHQPVDRSSVSVSVDLTGDGTVRRLAEGDTAAKSRGGKSADQVGETFSDQTGQKRKWKLWRNHCVPIRALFCGCSSLPRESVAEEEPGMVTCRVGSAAY